MHSLASKVQKSLSDGCSLLAPSPLFPSKDAPSFIALTKDLSKTTPLAISYKAGAATEQRSCLGKISVWAV
jgi:hypothetical protein